MKNRGVIADTCAWIDYFKPGQSRLKHTLEQELLNGTVYVCGPVLYEVAQGVRSAKERAAVVDALGAVGYLEMSEGLWYKAGELSSSLRSKGKTIPLSDVLIAVLAVENSLSVLTNDRHFREIPGLKVFKV